LVTIVWLAIAISQPWISPCNRAFDCFLDQPTVIFYSAGNVRKSAYGKKQTA